ncbi:MULTISPECIES: hypothetical protein, partial [unclassified Moorena]|uniref:hypothetical protein n=1 Tax=unclassified Moorena TaxID=2683338 RepID=UPI0025F5438B
GCVWLVLSRSLPKREGYDLGNSRGQPQKVITIHLDGGESPPLEETSDSLSWPHRARRHPSRVKLAPGRNQTPIRWVTLPLMGKVTWVTDSESPEKVSND